MYQTRMGLNAHPLAKFVLFLNPDWIHFQLVILKTDPLRATRCEQMLGDMGTSIDVLVTSWFTRIADARQRSGPTF